MPNSEHDFTLENRVLKFNGEAKPVSWWVQGTPINSRPGNRQGSARQVWNEARQAWIREVARAVKAERAGAPRDPDHFYAVTLQFSFRPPKNDKRDVDNFVKPVLDGLRDGLGVDDSRFRILLIHRLRNAETPEEEGVRIFVSSTGPLADPGATDRSGAEDSR